jgi:hypothetical protein
MQTQTLWLGCLVAVGVAGSPGLAQPPLYAVAGPVGPGPTPPPLTVDYHALIEGLREMHNSGADLFNLGDSAGCYHFFRGCLTATRSLLNAHPDLQALIDQRLQQAAAMPQMARRAFLLRETVEQVRDRLKAATPTATPTPVNAAVAGAMPAVTGSSPPAGALSPAHLPGGVGPVRMPSPTPSLFPTTTATAATAGGTAATATATPTMPATARTVPIRGTVKLGASRLAGVELQFLDWNSGSVVSTRTSADGSYSLPGLRVGEYTVTVHGGQLPARYSQPANSPLTVNVRPGVTHYDLSLDPTP